MPRETRFERDTRADEYAALQDENRRLRNDLEEAENNLLVAEASKTMRDMVTTEEFELGHQLLVLAEKTPLPDVRARALALFDALTQFRVTAAVAAHVLPETWPWQTWSLSFTAGDYRLRYTERFPFGEGPEERRNLRFRAPAGEVSVSFKRTVLNAAGRYAHYEPFDAAAAAQIASIRAQGGAGAVSLVDEDGPQLGFKA